MARIVVARETRMNDAAKAGETIPASLAMATATISMTPLHCSRLPIIALPPRVPQTDCGNSEESQI